MRNLFYILGFILFLCSCSRSRNNKVPAIYSEFVKDSFELYIDLPTNYNPADSNYSVVLYMDANLKMGKEIRRQIKLDENTANLNQVIFVGVGHIGPYRKLRRRDFIPPLIKKGEPIENNDPNFGHADKFYSFLINELMPYINTQYPNNGNYSYIGHSFSGLFAFYAMLQPKPVFKNYISLSPSLWANYNNFFEYESDFREKQTSIPVNLYHACGTDEWANKVLSTSRKMNGILTNQPYDELTYEYIEHKGKNHNGVVPVSIKYVLKNTKF